MNVYKLYGSEVSMEMLPQEIGGIQKKSRHEKNIFLFITVQSKALCVFTFAGIIWLIAP